MSVVVRTNRATNPNVGAAATNFTTIPGTGGSASGVRNTGAGYDGTDGFFRVTWSVGTSAVSGGASYLQTGLSASTQYTHSLYVKASKAQTIRIQAQYQNSSSVNVGSNYQGTPVTLVAGADYVRLDATPAATGAGVDRVVLTMVAQGGVNWAAGDTLDIDAILIETGAVLNPFYDGDYTAAQGIVYAWSGTVDASTSTATVYTPALVLEDKTDAPGARVEITITDLPPTEHEVTVWRSAGDLRQAVRSAQNILVTTSDFVTDYEAPLNRSASYSLEVLSGVAFGAPEPTESITVTSTCGYIQDPLIPESMIALYTDVGPNGEPYLQFEAIKSLEYPADVSLVPIMGSSRPVALVGQRMDASGVVFDLAITSQVMGQAVRDLMKSTPLVLIRPLPDWSQALPDLCYICPPTPKEHPINDATGGTIFEWSITTGFVAAPTMNVIVPVWTYTDVAALWGTYQQKQTALSGDSYLNVKKSPTGA